MAKCELCMDTGFLSPRIGDQGPVLCIATGCQAAIRESIRARQEARMAALRDLIARGSAVLNKRSDEPSTPFLNRQVYPITSSKTLDQRFHFMAYIFAQMPDQPRPLFLIHVWQCDEHLNQFCEVTYAP